jgi:hypothetical protein
MTQRKHYDVPVLHALRLAESVVLISSWLVYEFVRRLRGEPRASRPVDQESRAAAAYCRNRQ